MTTVDNSTINKHKQFSEKWRAEMRKRLNDSRAIGDMEMFALTEQAAAISEMLLDFQLTFGSEVME